MGVGRGRNMSQGSIIERGTAFALEAAERAWLPDALIRAGIRHLVGDRRRVLEREGDTAAVFADRMRKSPVAIETEAANEQHYEVPSAFYELVLGPQRKYSSCLFEAGDDLASAEERMLALTAERAQLQDGQRVLDLGCGWGSFSLWAAARYPGSQVLAISNSRTQRESITAMAQERGLSNLEVQTANASTLELAPGSFDRVVSIEMFEHLRNWEVLFERIAGWLEPDGCFLMHTFCHGECGYFYEDDGEGDWMARNFFSGGVMPARDLAAVFDRDLRVAESWDVDGTHYSKTLEAWLRNIDAKRPEVRRVLAESLGEAEADRGLQRWRMFMMACSELFAAQDGREWSVVHHRLVPVRR